MALRDWMRCVCKAVTPVNPGLSRSSSTPTSVCTCLCVSLCVAVYACEGQRLAFVVFLGCCFMLRRDLSVSLEHADSVNLAGQLSLKILFPPCECWGSEFRAARARLTFTRALGIRSNVFVLHVVSTLPAEPFHLFILA